MKAFVTSCGEATTDLCAQQLRRFGHDVILLDKEDQKWIDKYKEFIRIANEDCLRVDADCILNRNISAQIFDFVHRDYYMASFNGWDYYKNNIGVIGVTYYSKECLDILKTKLALLDPKRPETSAWRLPGIVEHTKNLDIIIGIHGLAQFIEHEDRHKKHKIERKQIGDYDFDLVKDIGELLVKII